MIDILTLKDGRSELYQWDTGRKLSVPQECSQVHFSNKVYGRSIDVDVVDGVAIIPDILLQTDKELTAWAFVGTAENGYTKISKVFKVKKRNKPADYVFTPTEQITVEKILERLAEIEDDIESGKLKGEPGFSPTVKVYEGDNGHRIYITSASGVEEVFIPNPKNANVFIASAGKTDTESVALEVKDGKPVCAIWPDAKVMWLQEATLTAGGDLSHATFSDGKGKVMLRPGSEWTTDGIVINQAAGNFQMTSLERLNSDYTVTLDFRLTGTSTDVPFPTLTGSVDREEGLQIRPLQDTTNPAIDVLESNGRQYRYSVRLSEHRGAQLTYSSNYFGDFSGVLRGAVEPDYSKHAEWELSDLPDHFERNKTYIVKIAKVGDTLKIKAWDKGAQEPNWQARYSNERISEYHPAVNGKCEWKFEIAHQNKGTDDEGVVVSNMVFQDANGNTFWDGVSEDGFTALRYFLVSGGSWSAYTLTQSIDADGRVIKAGQFALSDGSGGIVWESLTNVAEVGA